ncbi:MAG: pro-sigmaK processing inhibitor BofA family protein [Christensenellales bacterium]|jgi:inhibitor of the pro-sigma K processing machinery
MGLEIQWEVIVAFVAGLILLYVAGWLLLAPFKVLLRLLINGVLGGLLLWVVNLLGSIGGISIVINPVTALIAGVLGVPGVIMILVIKLIIGF